MSGSVNKVILVGNLGRDPEVHTTQAGAKIVRLAVATNEAWTDRQTGEKRQRTEWHRVVIFNERSADVAERFLRKGSCVYLEGELRTRKWTDQQGIERYTTEVTLPNFRGDLTLLDSKNDAASSSAQTTHQTTHQPSQHTQANTTGHRSMSDAAGYDDEIPF